MYSSYPYTSFYFEKCLLHLVIVEGTYIPTRHVQMYAFRSIDLLLWKQPSPAVYFSVVLGVSPHTHSTVFPQLWTWPVVWQSISCGINLPSNVDGAVCKHCKEKESEIYQNEVRGTTHYLFLCTAYWMEWACYLRIIKLLELTVLLSGCSSTTAIFSVTQLTFP